MSTTCLKATLLFVVAASLQLGCTRYGPCEKISQPMSRQVTVEHAPNATIEKLLLPITSIELTGPSGFGMKIWGNPHCVGNLTCSGRQTLDNVSLDYLVDAKEDGDVISSIADVRCTSQTYGDQTVNYRLFNSLLIRFFDPVPETGAKTIAEWSVSGVQRKGELRMTALEIPVAPHTLHNVPEGKLEVRLTLSNQLLLETSGNNTGVVFDDATALSIHGLALKRLPVEVLGAKR